MLRSKLTKTRLAAYLCALSVVLTPLLAQADTVMLLAEAETGSLAARQAADQKAALAKKAAERAAKKAQEAQAPTTGATPADNKEAAEVQKEK